MMVRDRKNIIAGRKKPGRYCELGPSLTSKDPGYACRWKADKRAARTLVAIQDQKRQKELADLIARKGLSVRETERLAAREGKKTSVKKPGLKQEDYETAHLVEDLRTIFGTKIDLQRRKDRGRIVIEYYSDDEFDRIIEMLLNAGK